MAMVRLGLGLWVVLSRYFNYECLYGGVGGVTGYFLVVLKLCGLLKERSILIDFRGKQLGFDFDFLAPKIWTVYWPK